jgi:hypothetical protein
MREESAVGTSLGWVPSTMMARLVRTIDVAKVAMSCTCQERGRIARITVRWYAMPKATITAGARSAATG